MCHLKGFHAVSLHSKELVRHVNYLAGIYASSERLLIQMYMILYPFMNYRKIKY